MHHYYDVAHAILSLSHVHETILSHPLLDEAGSHAACSAT